MISLPISRNVLSHERSRRFHPYGATIRMTKRVNQDGKIFGKAGFRGFRSGFDLLSGDIGPILGPARR